MGFVNGFSYLLSTVVEQEVRRGILHDNFDPDAVLWVNRTFNSLPHDGVSQHLRKYADGSGEAKNTEVTNFLQERLTLLKKQVQHRLLMNRNSTLKYQVNWTDDGLCPEKVAEHAEYVNKLCLQYEESVQRIIDKIIRNQHEKQEEKPFKSESLAGEMNRTNECFNVKRRCDVPHLSIYRSALRQSPFYF